MNFRCILLFVIASMIFTAPAVVRSAHPKLANSSVAIKETPQISIEPDGVVVQWQIPEPTITDESGALSIEIMSYETTGLPGHYLLPEQSMLVALPADAEPTVAVTAVYAPPHNISHPIAVAPQPEGVERNEFGEVVGGAFVPAPLISNEPLPLVSLDEIGIVRGIRLGRLTVRPVRPTGNHLLIAESVQAKVSFNSSAVATHVENGATEAVDSLTFTVQSMVVNPSQVQLPLTNSPAAALSMSASTPTAAIEVAEHGMTAVTYQALSAVGFPVNSVNPQNLQLKRDGSEVAIEWDGDGDTVFESNERFLFYADPRLSRWGNSDVYLLSEAATNGQRIVTLSASPTALSSGDAQQVHVAEKNTIYTPDCLCGSLPMGRDGERWVWSDLRQPGRPSETFTFDLSTVDTTQPSSLTVWFIGFTILSAAPDHQVDVSLNGSNLGSVSWDGKTAVTETLTIPAGVLQTSNTLELSVPERNGISIDGLWFDAVQVTYTRGSAAVDHQVRFQGESTRHAYTVSMANVNGLRAYDVTNPQVPIKLKHLNVTANAVTFGDTSDGNHSYVLSNNAAIQAPVQIRMLRDLRTGSTSGADYIMIAPEAFIPGLAPLVALRESQGLTVVIEDVQAIYDVYGNGRPSPNAIRAYLENAYTTWTPKPTYVVFVGDATSDPKQYKADSKATWVMPFLADVDPWIGEVPSDNRYVTLEGDDILPDMLAGRFPVNSLEETQHVVNKIVQYETAPVPGSWQSQISFVADDPDSAGNFENHSNALIGSFIKDPWRSSTFYLNEDEQTADELNLEIKNQWNNGSSMVFYTGHSSIHQWAAERVFHLDDVETLSNTGRLPVVVQMTCFTGSFHIPAFDTLDEALVRHESGGAIATWGATGLGVATGHDALADGYLQTLLIDKNPNLGQATLAGRVNVMNTQPAHRDLIDTFSLLGDPALQYDLDLTNYDVYIPMIVR